jgi:simple sugar transport system permease protein
MLFHTKLGYTIRMTGLNKNFARYSGMNAFWLFLVVHFISGFIGGVGSSVELLGMYNRFQWSALPGLGFTGALMAMLGRNHPVGVVAAAFAISYLRTGADIMARTTDVPVEIVAVVEAVVVLFVSSQYFLRKYHERALIKKGGEQHA